MALSHPGIASLLAGIEIVVSIPLGAVGIVIRSSTRGPQSDGTDSMNRNPLITILIAALTLLAVPSAARAEFFEGLKKENPNELLIVTESHECRVSDHELHKLVGDVLTLSGIEPIYGTGDNYERALSGELFLNVLIRCEPLTGREEFLYMIEVEFRRYAERTPDDSGWYRPDQGNYAAYGVHWEGLAEMIRRVVRDVVQRARVDYLESNYNLSDD
jgi:hypothetical protein